MPTCTLFTSFWVTSLHGVSFFPLNKAYSVHYSHSTFTFLPSFSHNKTKYKNKYTHNQNPCILIIFPFFPNQASQTSLTWLDSTRLYLFSSSLLCTLAGCLHNTHRITISTYLPSLADPILPALSSSSSSFSSLLSYYKVLRVTGIHSAFPASALLAHTQSRALSQLILFLSIITIILIIITSNIQFSSKRIFSH